MENLGGVDGERNTFLAVFLGQDAENLVELRQGLFTGGHKRVAAGDCRNLRNPRPIFLAVQDGFVFAQSHEITSRLKANIAPEEVENKSVVGVDQFSDSGLNQCCGVGAKGFAAADGIEAFAGLGFDAQMLRLRLCRESRASADAPFKLGIKSLQWGGLGL
jgi:hypothetical protein